MGSCMKDFGFYVGVSLLREINKYSAKNTLISVQKAQEPGPCNEVFGIY